MRDGGPQPAHSADTEILPTHLPRCARLLRAPARGVDVVLGTLVAEVAADAVILQGGAAIRVR